MGKINHWSVWANYWVDLWFGMLISALWFICLMVAVIGWPFMYIIDKIGG